MLARLFFCLESEGETRVNRSLPLKCQSECQFGQMVTVLKGLQAMGFPRFDSCRNGVNFSAGERRSVLLRRHRQLQAADAHSTAQWYVYHGVQA